jgi:hypothetical protein
VSNTLQDPPDLFRQDQTRQVNQYRGAQPGPRVGWAAGEEAELLVVRKGQLSAEFLIQAIDRLPRFPEPEPGEQDLESKMIFLIAQDSMGISRS